MPTNRQTRFYLLLIACAFLGLLDASIPSVSPTLQSIEPALSVLAFALIIAVGFKALPVGRDELPARRITVILAAAVLIAFALWVTMSVLGPHRGAGWYRNAPLILAFAAFTFILYRNFVLRPTRKP